MLSDPQEADATPCLFITRSDRDACAAGAVQALSWQQGAICKHARSVELIVANYVIRTPHPTQERCDQTTALLDA